MNDTINALPLDTMIEFPDVIRFELIDNNGTVNIKDKKDFQLCLQDNKKTLKIFIDGVINA
jgi:hypothetical protein